MFLFSPIWPEKPNRANTEKPRGNGDGSPSTPSTAQRNGTHSSSPGPQPPRDKHRFSLRTGAFKASHVIRFSCAEPEIAPWCGRWFWAASAAPRPAGFGCRWEHPEPQRCPERLPATLCSHKAEGLAASAASLQRQGLPPVLPQPILLLLPGRNPQHIPPPPRSASPITRYRVPAAP